MASFFSKPLPASSTDSRDSQSPFGVLEFLSWDHDWNGHHYTRDKAQRAVKLMREAGVGMVRMDFLWDDVQPAKDRWNFDKYDYLVDLLTKNNIKILALLDYTAGWAGDDWNSAPNPDLYTEYAKAVVHRYKNKIRYWEIWNEPNYPVYWVPQDHMETYTKLLKKVYPVLKAEDPTAVIVLGGLAANAALSLAEIYHWGGKDFFDVVNFHPFKNPLDHDAIKKMRADYDLVRRAMSENHDEKKPIWLTELGCPGTRASKETQDWWLGRNPDENEQAEWVEKIYREPLSWPGVEKVFWAFFRDTPDHFLSGTDYFGLVREDFSKKPAFEAYRRAATGKRPASPGER